MYKEFSLQFISQLGILARAVQRAVFQLHDTRAAVLPTYIKILTPTIGVFLKKTTTIHTMAGLNPTEEPLQSFYAQLNAQFTQWQD